MMEEVKTSGLRHSTKSSSEDMLMWGNCYQMPPRILQQARMFATSMIYTTDYYLNTMVKTHTPSMWCQILVKT